MASSFLFSLSPLRLDFASLSLALIFSCSITSRSSKSYFSKSTMLFLDHHRHIFQLYLLQATRPSVLLLSTPPPLHSFCLLSFPAQGFKANQGIRNYLQVESSQGLWQNAEQYPRAKFKKTFFITLEETRDQKWSTTQKGQYIPGGGHL